MIEQEPRFSDLVDVEGQHLCPRRSEVPAEALAQYAPGHDYWQKFKTNGQRVCSYCGSLHPDDFFALVEQAANAPEDSEYRAAVAIEPSDKQYKVYVHQPGVRNAHDGGIKFYKQHLAGFTVTAEHEQVYQRALLATERRFQRFMADRTVQGWLNN